jgi:hypothetical protein
LGQIQIVENTKCSIVASPPLETCLHVVQCWSVIFPLAFALHHTSRCCAALPSSWIPGETCICPSPCDRARSNLACIRQWPPLPLYQLVRRLLPGCTASSQPLFAALLCFHPGFLVPLPFSVRPCSKQSGLRTAMASAAAVSHLCGGFLLAARRARKDTVINLLVHLASGDGHGDTNWGTVPTLY